MVVQASQTAIARLKKDYARLMKEPIPFMRAAPLQSNILEWHYIIFGAPNTPYDGGIYHGKLIFPADFPFKPPAISMITPSGRFQTNTRLCLSISDFHPDTWNPAWTVGTIITGLLSFMNDTSPTLGSINTTDSEKKILARKSKAFNIKDRVFCELFEDVADQIRKDLALSEDSKSSSSPDDQSGKRSDSTDGGGTTLSAIASNVLVIAGVVLLAFAVRYVVLSAQEADPSFRGQ